MGLLDAAAHLLGQADGPMQGKDLGDQAHEGELWAPSKGVKTLDRTLYAAILREINTNGDASLFRKVERGPLRPERLHDLLVPVSCPGHFDRGSLRQRRQGSRASNSTH